MDDTQIKGSIGKYNFPTENSYYTDVPNPRTNQKEVAHYYKGKFNIKFYLFLIFHLTCIITIHVSIWYQFITE